MAMKARPFFLTETIELYFLSNSPYCLTRLIGITRCNFIFYFIPTTGIRYRLTLAMGIPFTVPQEASIKVDEGVRKNDRCPYNLKTHASWRIH